MLIAEKATSASAKRLPRSDSSSRWPGLRPVLAESGAGFLLKTVSYAVTSLNEAIVGRSRVLSI